MTSKVKVIGLVGPMVALVFFVALLALPATAVAGAKVAAVEGMAYNVGASLQDNLKSLVGKKVYVTLDSGKSFGGVVKEVGNNFVHLEKLDGKDFFDALIRIEDVSAVDAKFRDFQR